MNKMNHYGRHSHQTKLNLVTWMLAAGAVAIMFATASSLAGTDSAREWLEKGGVIIDVRSAAEFKEKHLPAAVNIPLDRLGEEVARRFPDKQKPLLLHCLSGGRSAKGTSLLKKLGYQNVFNLGSYKRAEEAIKPR